MGLDAFFRYCSKGVLGNGVGNNKNASEMRQKAVRNASEMCQNGSCLIGKRGTFQNASKMSQKCVKMRQKCAEHLWGRTPFGRYQFFIRSEEVQSKKSPNFWNFAPSSPRIFNDFSRFVS